MFSIVLESLGEIRMQLMQTVHLCIIGQIECLFLEVLVCISKKHPDKSYRLWCQMSEFKSGKEEKESGK